MHGGMLGGPASFKGLPPLITVHWGATAAAIDEDKTIPPEAKKTILGQIRSLAKNPYVMAVVPPLIVEALKKRLGL
jgi:hypothetical protein